MARRLSQELQCYLLLFTVRVAQECFYILEFLLSLDVKVARKDKMENYF